MTKEKFIRTGGKLYNMENNVINRTLVESIDDHQMAIYELLQNMFPNTKGYEATAKKNDDGSVTTALNIIIEKEGK